MSRLNVDDGMPVGVEEYDYKFAENNPFLEDPEPLARGKELFRTVRAPVHSQLPRPGAECLAAGC